MVSNLVCACGWKAKSSTGLDAHRTKNWCGQGNVIGGGGRSPKSPPRSARKRTETRTKTAQMSAPVPSPAQDVRCPICGSETQVRTAKKGSGTGYKFYGCVRWPDCDGTLDVEGVVAGAINSSRPMPSGSSATAEDGPYTRVPSSIRQDVAGRTPQGDQTFDPKPLRPIGDKVRAQVDRWKKSLFDLTGRNRLIYYRSVSPTLILEESADHAFRVLQTDGTLILDRANLIGRADEPHVQLAAALKKARRLSQVARTYREEQGVHVIYLALGWLHWVDLGKRPTSRDKTVETAEGKTGVLATAPLVLIPVDISVEKNKAMLTLNRQEEIQLNPSLLRAVAAQIDISVDLPEGDAIDPPSVVTAWESAIAGLDHWRVEWNGPVLVDYFSFKKLAMVRAMDEALQAISDHPVLSALCGDSELLGETQIPRFDDLDQRYPSGAAALVVPADSSQLQAVLSASLSKSFVVQGPPGTGKSQTITNLISTLLSQGKRVLFVAEKRAARDIVVRNLKGAGVGETILHLTSEVTASRGSREARNKVLDELEATLRRGPGKYDVDGQAAQNFERVRDRLNQYERDLHSPLGHEEWSSPFNLMAQAQTVDTRSDPSFPEAPSASEVDEMWLTTVLEVAEAIDDLGEQGRAAINSEWIQTTLGLSTFETPIELKEALTSMSSAKSRLFEIWRLINAPQITSKDPKLRELENHALALVAVYTHSVGNRKFMRRLTPKYWRNRATAAKYRSEGGDVTGSEEQAANELMIFVDDLKRALECVQGVGLLRLRDTIFHDIGFGLTVRRVTSLNRYAASLPPCLEDLGSAAPYCSQADDAAGCR